MAELPSETFRREVRAAREAFGVRQYQLATMAGLSRIATLKRVSLQVRIPKVEL